MNFFTKQKLWFFIALFFIVVNAVLVSGMFMHRGHRQGGKDRRHEGRHEMHNGHRGGAKYLTQLMIDSLGFSKEQQAILTKSNEELNLKKDSVSEANEKCKELFIQELYSENPNKMKLDSLSKCISANTEKYNQLRIESVEKIRAACTAEQKKKISSFLDQSHNEYYNRRRNHN